MNSLKQTLLNYWKAKNEWINGGDGEKIAALEGFKASNASRRLRELCREGLLERELRPMRSGGKSVWYRYAKAETKNNQTTSMESSKSVYQTTGQILRNLQGSASPTLRTLFTQ